MAGRRRATTNDPEHVTARIRSLQRDRPGHAVLVGISGIDASGKGHVTDRLAASLASSGVRVAVIHADGWLNLPSVRFNATRSAAHFYEHAFRFDEMFDELVLPLITQRSVHVEAAYTEETAHEYRPHLWTFDDVDVVLIEAIFLFKRAHRSLFDLAVWVDCTFETALERAIARAQEGLPPAETIHAYQTLYFAAQRIHAERDDPHGRADLVLVNDARLVARPDTTYTNGNGLHRSPTGTRPTTRSGDETNGRTLASQGWSIPEAVPFMRSRFEEAWVRLPL